MNNRITVPSYVLVKPSSFFSPSNHLGISNPYKPCNALGTKPVGKEWVIETDQNHFDNTQALKQDWAEKIKLLKPEKGMLFTKKYIQNLVQQEIKGQISKRACSTVSNDLKKFLEKYKRQEETKKNIDLLEKHVDTIKVSALINKVNFIHESSISQEEFESAKEMTKEMLKLAAKEHPLVALALEVISKSPKGFCISLSDYRIPSGCEGAYHIPTHSIILPPIRKTNDPQKDQLLIQTFANTVAHEAIHYLFGEINNKKIEELSTIAEFENLALAKLGLLDEDTVQKMLLMLPVAPKLSKAKRMEKMTKLNRKLQEGEGQLKKPEIQELIGKTYTPRSIPIWIESNSENAKQAKREVDLQGKLDPLTIKKAYVILSGGTEAFMQTIIPAINGNSDLLLVCHLEHPDSKNKQERNSAFTKDLQRWKFKAGKTSMDKYVADIKDPDELKYHAIMENFTQVLAEYPWNIVKTAYADLLGFIFERGYLLSEEILDAQPRQQCDNPEFSPQFKKRF
jgi:hypothetical protein